MAAPPVYITQADLEERYGPTHVRQIWSPKGSNVPDTARLGKSCAVASRQADAILAKAWPAGTVSPDAIEKLVANDDAVKDAICDLAMAHGVKGKPEWSGEGAPYAGIQAAARKMLEDIARGQLRPRGELEAGSNPNVRGHVRSPDNPQFMFAPSRARPRPGGY